jgi:isopentenyl diphosphate isomerase/L-lactate dehydrogenase-like FMN-dependent dehydrogenase
MNRRDFTRVLAAGTAARFLPGEARAQQPTTSPSSGTLDPVCVADFRELAKAKLPGTTFDYVETGTMDQVTLRENTAAFQRLKLLPPVLSGVAATDLTTTALGVKLSLPIMLAPVAAQRMYHPQGALAAARAAAAVGTIFGTSSSATNSVEEIAAASPGSKWFQLYVPKDRTIARRLVERAEESGYKALIVTVDLGEWKDADRRNQFTLPPDMMRKHLRDLGYTSVTDAMTPAEMAVFSRENTDLTFSWNLFEWLRSVTKLPLIIKGVLRPEDARRAVDLGLDGIVVSNHGGRRLDGMPASIEMLPQVVAAVDGRAEVFLDSGIRRGTDVLKALGLGARAVLVGRPYVYGLAADGETGVRKVLEILRDELQNVMIASGCRSVRDVPRSLVMH